MKFGGYHPSKSVGRSGSYKSGFSGLFEEQFVFLHNAAIHCRQEFLPHRAANSVINAHRLED